MDELTPKELIRLAKTRQTMEWDHTAMILSMGASMTAKRGRSYKPEDFNPYRSKLGRQRSGGLSLEQFASRVKGMKSGA